MTMTDDGREGAPHPFTRGAIAVYIVMLCMVVAFGHYIVTYVIFIVAYLGVVVSMYRHGFLDGVRGTRSKELLMSLFFLAVIVRALLLFQDQVITRDIVLYVKRSQWLIDGLVPYVDFNVNKPPLFAYLIQGLGTTIGTGEVQFRAFFSVMDAVVALLIFELCASRYDEVASFKAAFAYAICPLPIVSIGLAGHYEPVVMVFVILSLLLLMRGREHLSALSLGMGFALKFFPVVLLPFFAWKLRSWGGRATYVVLFAVPMLLSMVPMLLTRPDALWEYLYNQGLDWEAKKSFAFALEMLYGSQGVLGIDFSLIFQVLFVGIIAAMFLAWAAGRFDPSFWFKAVLLSFVVDYGLAVAASLGFYSDVLGISDPRPLMVAVAIVYLLVVMAVFGMCHRHLDIEVDGRERMFLLAAFALAFFLFSSSQFNPWYLLWVLPFVLVLRNGKVRFALLLILFWNIEGIGLALLPGISLG